MSVDETLLCSFQVSPEGRLLIETLKVQELTAVLLMVLLDSQTRREAQDCPGLRRKWARSTGHSSSQVQGRQGQGTVRAARLLVAPRFVSIQFSVHSIVNTSPPALAPILSPLLSPFTPRCFSPQRLAFSPPLISLSPRFFLPPESNVTRSRPFLQP